MTELISEFLKLRRCIFNKFHIDESFKITEDFCNDKWVQVQDKLYYNIAPEINEITLQELIENNYPFFEIEQIAYQPDYSVIETEDYHNNYPALMLFKNENRVKLKG